MGGFLPIIDHPHFQRLRWRKQLGVNYLVFPGAVHTRFEHAIGSLGLTQRLCRIHRVSADDERLLGAFALLHDIGHGPFSHQIEPIIGGSHHEQGCVLLSDMTDELRACGVDPAAMASMVLGTHPLARLITDRNLGTDKLDYLMRDALHIGFTGAPDIERLQFYTRFDSEALAIEEKFIEDIKRLQKFYSYLHQHGYLNKTALTVQRMFQRAVQLELGARSCDPATLWRMADDELIAWLRHGRHPESRRLLKRFQTRRFHRTVLAIKPEGYGFVERASDKPMAVLEWPRSRLRRFSTISADRDRLLDLEDRLADACALAPGDLLFSAMPYFRKLLPKDVRVHSTGRGGDYWLFEKDRDHKRSLEGDYLRTFAVRVTVVPDARSRLADRTSTLADLIQEACESGASGES